MKQQLPKKPRKVTLSNKVKAELELLEIGDELDKTELILKYWEGTFNICGDLDYFVMRTFDVAFFHARKNLPERKFKTKSKIITRIF